MSAGRLRTTPVGLTPPFGWRLGEDIQRRFPPGSHRPRLAGLERATLTRSRQRLCAAVVYSCAGQTSRSATCLIRSTNPVHTIRPVRTGLVWESGASGRRDESDPIGARRRSGSRQPTSVPRPTGERERNGEPRVSGARELTAAPRGAEASAGGCEERRNANASSLQRWQPRWCSPWSSRSLSLKRTTEVAGCREPRRLTRTPPFLRPTT